MNRLKTSTEGIILSLKLLSNKTKKSKKRNCYKEYFLFIAEISLKLNFNTSPRVSLHRVEEDLELEKRVIHKCVKTKEYFVILLK
jgi:hypothetical protein